METTGQSGNQIADPAGTIVFDTSSGISLEEQQEILAGINAMAAGNKLTSESLLSAEAAETKAKKKGYLFPLFVNIGAFVLIVAAFALLNFFNNSNEQEIRESRAVLGLTERMLIQEIRQETERKISEKEAQINDVSLKLKAVDTEYKNLQASVENMTAAQKQRAASLLVLHDEYQRTLLGLNDEKAWILEDSRQREEELRAQAEERAVALSSQMEQSRQELDAAMDELRSLGTEQERANRAERQMNGFYASLDSQIGNGRLDEAADTIKSMREFLNAPSLRGIRIFEARKQTHLAAIDVMEKVLASSSDAAAIQDTAQEEALEEMKARNTALERMLAAFTAEGADQNRIITEYAAALSELETSNASQQDALNKQDSEIQNLRTEIAQREQRVTELTGSMAVLQAQYDDLQRRMEAAIRAFTGE
jgi:chromosome segregation ATPase